MKSNKSPYPDVIQNRVVKECKPEIAELLTVVYNFLFKTTSIPAERNFLNLSEIRIQNH